MALHRKPLERRTYSQDRYYALIKKQKSGKATFKELTELDEIVNRVPDIREQVIRESFMADETQDTDQPMGPPPNINNIYTRRAHRHGLWSRIKTWIDRVFATQIFVGKNKQVIRIKAHLLLN